MRIVDIDVGLVEHVDARHEERVKSFDDPCVTDRQVQLLAELHPEVEKVGWSWRVVEAGKEHWKTLSFACAIIKYQFYRLEVVSVEVWRRNVFQRERALEELIVEVTVWQINSLLHVFVDEAHFN